MRSASGTHVAQAQVVAGAAADEEREDDGRAAAVADRGAERDALPAELRETGRCRRRASSSAAMLMTLTMPITTRPLTVSPAPRRQAMPTRSIMIAGSTQSSMTRYCSAAAGGGAVEAHEADE